jgi:tetrahydromethanopterin S-methyltransferase subunit B
MIMDYVTRKTELESKVNNISDGIDVLKSQRLEDTSLYEITNLLKIIKKCNEEIDDLINELEVEDFLLNGNGRTREGVYDTNQ